MHARYRSPLTSRFLSTDPILGNPKMPQSWNRYAYTRGNPLSRIDPDGRADKGTGDGVISTVCGDHACPPSDPVGRALNTLMIAAFAAPIQGALVPAKAAGAVALSQASNAVAGAISNPQDRLTGALVGAAVGTVQGRVEGGLLTTPIKNVLGAGFASFATSGSVDPKGVGVAAATGTAVGWLDFAAQVGAKSPGGVILQRFAMGMDAMLQVLGAFGTPAPTAANSSCANGSSCQGTDH